MGFAGRPSARPKHDLQESVATASTTRLALIAGRYVGKDDPILIVRCQSGLPALGEVLEPFSYPRLVAGWMRGAHHGPLMPCGLADATPAMLEVNERLADRWHPHEPTEATA